MMKALHTGITVLLAVGVAILAAEFVAFCGSVPR